MFKKGKPDWLSELPSAIEQNTSSIDNSTKFTPIQASKKANGKKIYDNRQNRGVRQTRNIEIGQLARTADFKRVF